MLAMGFGGPALAQVFSLDLGEGGGDATGRIIQLIALLTVLSIAPAILVMVTSFTRIIVVLPFKIIFFVLVDGWYMVVGSLVRSFGG